MRRSFYYDDYPSVVSELTEKLLEGLDEENFFDREGADYNITFRRFADSVLKNWIRGDDLGDISERDFTEILNLSMVETRVEHMTHQGVLDSIPNDKGETVYFLTEKGRSEIKKILGDKNNFDL